MKAIWNKQVIAESENVINIEGNIYFPVDSVNRDLLVESDTKTVCHWKGTASYYNVVAGNETNPDAAWYYPEPRPLADGIQGRVAFWKGVKVMA